MTIVKVM